MNKDLFLIISRLNALFHSVSDFSVYLVIMSIC